MISVPPVPLLDDPGPEAEHKHAIGVLQRRPLEDRLRLKLVAESAEDPLDVESLVVPQLDSEAEAHAVRIARPEGGR